MDNFAFCAASKSSFHTQGGAERHGKDTTVKQTKLLHSVL